MVEVQVTELPRTTRIAVCGDATLFGDIFGVRLPTEACRASVNGARAALWLGPDEWLLLLPGDAPAVTDLPVSVVDISHRQIAIEVAGSAAVPVINAFCALDLHPSAFPPGACTRTVFGKAEIVLWRTAADLYHIEIARSFAPYLRGCLDEACREFVV